LDRLCKTTSSPPSPPVFSTAMSVISNDGKYLTVSIQELGQKRYEWLVAITPAGNALPIGSENTVNLSWELSEESYTGTFQLIKQKVEDGEFVDDEITVEDMSTMDSVQITGDDRKQYFKIVCKTDAEPAQPDCQFQFELAEGWNLISLPLLPENNIAKYVIPTASVIYQYQDGGYKEILGSDVLKTGVGYWVLVPSDVTHRIEGQCVNSYSKELSIGWHLLGCIHKQTLPGTGLENSIEVMYEYVDGSYEIVTECRAGNGFWVNMLENDTLTLHSADLE